MISIIIPVYNVSQYIRRCLDSVLVQTGMEWECILVDDGSPDDSGGICDEYSARDSRFKVIHKTNGGVSSARNEGLKIAKGEWIVFVDADDFIEPNYISVVSDIITLHHSLDMIVFDMQEGLEDGKVIKSKLLNDFLEQSCHDVKIISDTSQILRPSLKGASFVNSPCNKVYRTSIIKNNELLFTKRVRGEDWLFNIEYILFVRKAAFTRAVLYNYMRNGISAMTKYCPEQFQLWSENFHTRMRLIRLFKWNVDIKEMHRSLYENAYYFLREVKAKEPKATRKQKLCEVIYSPLLKESLKALPTNLHQVRAWVCINWMRLTI